MPVLSCAGIKAWFKSYTIHALLGIAIVIATACIWFFLWYEPESLLAKVPRCTDKYLEADNRNRTAVLTAVGGLVGVCGLLLSWRQLQANQATVLINTNLSLSNNRSALKTQILAQQGQITTRFKDASILLGNENFAVRVGAIAALGRILHDSQEALDCKDTPSPDYWPILDVLVAYIQTNATPDVISSDFSAFEKSERFRPDLQAVLNVIARRKYIFAREDDSPFDFAGVVLRYAYFLKGNFDDAYLQGTDLSYSWMMGARFEKVNFSHANLTGCLMQGCSIKGSQLAKATGLTQAQIDECILDEHTSLPSHIKRPPQRQDTVI